MTVRFRGGLTVRVGIALCAVAAIAPSVPRLAEASTTGIGSFSGTVAMSGYPCPSPNCPGGSFTGTAGLTLSGFGTASLGGAGPAPYTAAWPSALGNLTIPSFTYATSCGISPAGVPPLQGSGGGLFSLTGGTLILGGGTISNVTLAGMSAWQWTATALVVTLSDLTITTDAGTVAVNLTNQVLTGRSASGFVWTSLPGTCGGVPQPENALVAGVAVQPA